MSLLRRPNGGGLGGTGRIPLALHRGLPAVQRGQNGGGLGGTERFPLALHRGLPAVQRRQKVAA